MELRPDAGGSTDDDPTLGQLAEEFKAQNDEWEHKFNRRSRITRWMLIPYILGAGVFVYGTMQIDDDLTWGLILGSFVFMQACTWAQPYWFRRIETGSWKWKP